jgi:Zn-dependent M28 family amino/carboxypeptidase
LPTSNDVDTTPTAEPGASSGEAKRRRRKRWLVVSLAGVVGLPAVLLLVLYLGAVRMPGSSFAGALPAAQAGELELAVALKRDVEQLANGIGERNHQHPEALAQAADYVQRRLEEAGYEVERQRFEADTERGTQGFDNLIAEVAGATLASEVIVVGAHYDSAQGTPAANDNGTGVAALLALAAALHDSAPRRTLRFVAFANEEPPHFKQPSMGSLHYAERCKQRGDDVVAMLSLETMGYYRDEPGSQKYPAPLSSFYPDTGNFIGVVGDLSSRPLVQLVIDSFRRHTSFPSEGAALPASIPGVGWSDHWAFWQQGYPAVMITDTAPFRYPHYHQPEDTPDKVDFERLARVVDGLEKVIAELVGRVT